MDVSDSKSGSRCSSLNVVGLSVNIQTEELSLSSTYEPERMPDFDQDLCLNGARLVQQPVFDLDAKLVAPWRAPAVFRKGALVAIEAHLIVYHFMADEKPNHVCCLPLMTPSQHAYRSGSSISLPPPGPYSWRRLRMSTNRSGPFPARR